MNLIPSNHEPGPVLRHEYEHDNSLCLCCPEHNVENIWICSSGLVRSGRPVSFPVCGHVMVT